MRTHRRLAAARRGRQFLSIQAQDFIEDQELEAEGYTVRFLSIQAQDFIEENRERFLHLLIVAFLSIQAQDFIEERYAPPPAARTWSIPEHSSSGLH